MKNKIKNIFNKLTPWSVDDNFLSEPHTNKKEAKF